MVGGESQKLKELYEFGPFRVDAEKEILLRAGEPIPLQPKTFQILLVLIRRPQEVVTKDDLMKAVWPDTFVEEANLSRNIFLLRKAMGESPQDHQYILTVPGRGYRFAEDVRLVPERAPNLVDVPKPERKTQTERKGLWRLIAAGALCLAVACAAAWLWMNRQPALTDKATIVLADFENSTGDPVFDGTLRQGLSVQLDQSPFLSQVSDGRIRQTLTLMGKNPDQHLSSDIGRDICQRTGSAAVLSGSIASLGSQYIVGLRAVECRRGDVLAEEQESASSKEKIIAALDQASAKLRRKLGESLSTVERFGTPLEEATTPSLEALQAYSLGRTMMVGRDEFAKAVPFFQRAIQLDPNFAMAYAALGSTYRTLGESELASENIQQAYERRAHLTQPEQFYIESSYYHFVTRDFEKARQVYELSALTYPRYSGTHLRLWELYSEFGEYEKALVEIREAIRLDPTRAIDYVNLLVTYINLDRLQDARNTVKDIRTRQINGSSFQLNLYLLDFLEGDTAGMQEVVKGTVGDPSSEGSLMAMEAETSAYAGRTKKSREFFKRAIDSTTHAGEKELAAFLEADESFLESLAGNTIEAQKLAASALRRSKGRDVVYEAVLGLSFAGDEAQARAIAEDTAKRFPDDTRIQFDLLPIARARLALSHNDPSQAIALLQPAARYEFGRFGWTRLAVIYVRGGAYLAAHQWMEAAAEFQKILNHPGIIINHPFHSLAYLQQARAYAGAGQKTKAKACYEEFLHIWKDGDSDAHLLKEVEAEYAKLQ
jgi:DNA-binding winged helix-turn-helix (wHTH) protein/tetratricopeptide (TPR) repeat protein